MSTLEQTEDIEQVTVAFAAALTAVQNIAKTQTADTGKYKYSYADLGDVLEEVKRALGMFNLSITQIPTAIEGAGGAWMLSVEMAVIHDSGQVLGFDPLVIKLPADPQAYGSALTYARRYQLLSVFGIAPEDDDGRAATEQARHAQGDGNRTEAETKVRKLLQDMDHEMRNQVVKEFREHFGAGLTDLPAGRHGEALTWVVAQAAALSGATAPEPEAEVTSG